MSVNDDLPHVLVLPEDRANFRIANEFHLQVPWNRQRQMQVLRVAGGRKEVLSLFKSEHEVEMRRCRYRSMILLIDFDGNEGRLRGAKGKIPTDLTDRVFILGALTNPEALKQASLGSYEKIGRALAKDCREETDTIWGHELLRHNSSELDRLREHVHPILFPPN